MREGRHRTAAIPCDAAHLGNLLLDEGVPLSSISDMLGHASLAITAGIYAHVGDELRTETAEKMESLLG